MSDTPRTNIAVYNGGKYLRDECAALEIENRNLRDRLDLTIKSAGMVNPDASTLPVPRELLEELHDLLEECIQNDPEPEPAIRLHRLLRAVSELLGRKG